MIDYPLLFALAARHHELVSALIAAWHILIGWPS